MRRPLQVQPGVMGILLFLSLPAISDPSREVCERSLVAPEKTLAPHYNEPALVLVDAFSNGNLVPEKLHEAGIQVIHVQSAPEIADAYMRSSFQDGPVYTEKLICHEGVNSVLPTIRRYQNILGVLAGSEIGAPRAHELARALSLPRNHRADQDPSLLIHKGMQKEILDRQGIRTVEGVVASNKREIETWLDSQQGQAWPVIVKPVDDAGSSLLKICDTEDCVYGAFQSILGEKNIHGKSNTRALVQNFIGDPEELNYEYALNFVSKNGVHVPSDFWRYHKVLIPGAGTMYQTDELLSPDDPVFRILLPFGMEVLEKIGHEEGATHIEVFLLPSDPKRPIFSEIGFRPSGGEAPRTTAMATGMSQIDLLVESYQDPLRFMERAGLPYSLHKHARLRKLRSPGGVYYNWFFIRTLQNLPSVQGFYPTFKNDEILPRTKDLDTSGGGFILVHEDPKQLDSDLKAIDLMESEGIIFSSQPTPQK